MLVYQVAHYDYAVGGVFQYFSTENEAIRVASELAYIHGKAEVSEVPLPEILSVERVCDLMNGVVRRSRAIRTIVVPQDRTQITVSGSPDWVTVKMPRDREMWERSR